MQPPALEPVEPVRPEAFQVRQHIDRPRVVPELSQQVGVGLDQRRARSGETLDPLACMMSLILSHLARL